MKEIIPIKKDILFKTIIGKITNINLEHDYKIKDNLIEGNVLLYGTYKMTEASVLEEEFEYKIPFGIALVKNINKDTIKIEIEDFNYEIRKDILNVNINLEFDCEEVSEKIEDTFEEKVLNEEIIEDKEDEISNIEFNNIESINDITNNVINSDENKYYTYKVYIVRKDDTIESICSKYNVTINDISEYNDISNVDIGDKIIIPQINE